MDARKVKVKAKGKKFAHEFVKNGFNARAAYLSINPNAQPHSADTGAWRMLKKEEVAKQVLIDVSKITPEWIKEQLEVERNKSDARAADRIRCLENQARIAHLFSDNQINISTNVITPDDIQKIREAIRPQLAAKRKQFDNQTIPTDALLEKKDEALKVVTTSATTTATTPTDTTPTTNGPLTEQTGLEEKSNSLDKSSTPPCPPNDTTPPAQSS